MRAILKKSIIIMLLAILITVLGLSIVFNKRALSNNEKKYPEIEAIMDKEKELAKGEWLVAQLADESGEQACCYILSDSSHLIIIDGGWSDNADKLRKIIGLHNDCVDAWFISHPHRDHASAYNKLASDLRGITINTVYDNSYDYDFIEQVGEPYDDIKVMEDFYVLADNSIHKKHLKRNDVLEVCGLSIKVLNAFDDAVKENVGEEKDYQNNASLCLKITNKKQSFLYTADIKKDMSKYLYTTYKNELDADYVQLSHHGNWGLKQKRYDKMSAKYFFLDAPANIYDNDYYPAHKLKRHLEENSKLVYTFDTAPNIVILQ